MSPSIYFTQVGADQECQSPKTTTETGAENGRAQVWPLLPEMVAPGSCRGRQPWGDWSIKGSRGTAERAWKETKGKQKNISDNTVFIQKWLYFYLILRTPLFPFISSQTLLCCSQPSFSFSYSAEYLFATTKKINLKTSNFLSIGTCKLIYPTKKILAVSVSQEFPSI